MQPLIRWAGSKRAIVKQLRAHYPGGGSRYVEPFAGSACLFFEILPSRAVLGDLNWELITSYRAIRRDPRLVIECFRRLRRGERSYYAIRKVDPRTLSEAQVAARFLFLNRNCFNGLYRTGRGGRFNVPYGPPRGPEPRIEQRILDVAMHLRGATLVHADFEETLSEVEAGDFVYLDPPYVVETRRVFSEYLPGSFSSADLIRLRACLERLDSRGIDFLVSYADSAEARKLLKDWTTRRIMTRRNIAGFAGARRGSYELLATNQRQPPQKNGNP